MGENALDPWIQFFKTLLDMDVPGELASFTEDIDEIERRNKTIFWRIKGIAAKTSFSMFLNYGNPEKVENDPEIKAFAAKF